MSYALYYDVPGNEQIYERVKAELGDEPPDGLLLQLVVKHDEGLRHFHVWESEGQFGKFQQERVGPAVAKVLSGMGIPVPAERPEVNELEVIDFTDVATPSRS